ncbi:hypothetical protein [Hymenobacter coccineus]|uniref:Uncharacterized protein n=1 Tax=Hymenobacter coccineus TaxID=1908235 RepID=A0A1G1THC5_9BACT|nr:hypothetical protein [Hymenobacter coccineus]OGX90279.1 hypothetical protein BEN49_23265 [Hymenobacter coccineus]
MKKLLASLLLSALGSAGHAQALRPPVGPGTTFSYVLELHGQHAPLELRVQSARDTLKLGWQIRGFSGGPTPWPPPPGRARRRCTLPSRSPAPPCRCPTKPS